MVAVTRLPMTVLSVIVIDSNAAVTAAPAAAAAVPPGAVARALCSNWVPLIVASTLSSAAPDSANALAGTARSSSP